MWDLGIAEFSRMRLLTGQRGKEPRPDLSIRNLSDFGQKLEIGLKKGNRKNGEPCERYGTSLLRLERPTERYVPFISKLDRKHCRMLVGFLTGHINLQMLQKMRRATTPSSRCGTEKETSVHILCGCPALKKLQMQTMGFARMDMKQTRSEVSGIVALGKGTGLLNSPYQSQWSGL